MKLSRHQFLHLAAGAAALPAISRIAMAQTYPTRPVRIVVSTAAGGEADLLARLMGQWLSKRLGRQFVVENRPGAGTNIGTEVVVKAPPDGYTLLLGTGTAATNAALYSDKLNFNFIRDIAPVAAISRVPLVMLMQPSLPAKTVPEFIDHAKANPGKINMASPGIGSLNHVAVELFKTMAGLNMVHVPYRGVASLISDMLGGQVQLAFPAFSTSLQYIRAGTLRALAVTTATRLEHLPDMPTLGEFVPGYEASNWFGIVAPRNTPAEIVDLLNKEINTALADPTIRRRFSEQGDMVLPGSAADFGKLIADDTEKWGKVIRAAGIKAE
jgi:tripartite-type tricarboxylate transporter receptor subunit TctC